MAFLLVSEVLNELIRTNVTFVKGRPDIAALHSILFFYILLNNDIKFLVVFITLSVI